MDIGFYTHYFAPEVGAPSARVYDLSQAWRASGHVPHIVTCFPNHPDGVLYPGYRGGRYLNEQFDNLDVHRSWSYVTPNTGFVKKTLGHISFMPSAWLFSGRHVPPLDVVIGTSPTFFAAMAAAGTGLRRRIPFIMEVRDLWPAIFVELGVLRNRQLIWLLERLELALYRRATRVVTVTESFRQNLIDRGIPSTKVVTIPNGADIDYWQPMPKPAELQARLGLQDRFVVLYIGTHGIAHALASILESARQLSDEPRIEFLFVGSGAEKEKLARRAEELGLTNTRFLDPVPKQEVRDYYALSDVCLVPLRDIPLFETFLPSKMFEIMAMGRPILASLRGEAAGILNRSGGATVVAPEDSTAIAGAIRELFLNPQIAAAMGQRGRQFVTDNYSRQALARQYLQVIDEACRDYHGVKAAP